MAHKMWKILKDPYLKEKLNYEGRVFLCGSLAFLFIFFLGGGIFELYNYFRFFGFFGFFLKLLRLLIKVPKLTTEHQK